MWAALGTFEGELGAIGSTQRASQSDKLLGECCAGGEQERRNLYGNDGVGAELSQHAFEDLVGPRL